MYVVPFNPMTQKAIVTGYTYYMTLVGVFIIYSIFVRCTQWRQRSRQKAHADGALTDPVVIRTPSLYRWLNHSLNLPFISPNLPVKRMLYILVLLVVNCAYILRFPKYALAPVPDPGVNLLTVGYHCAYVGLVNISIAIILITRNSIVKLISTKSFDETMPLHRLHGLLGLAEITVHAGSQININYALYKDVTFTLTGQQDRLTGFMSFLSLFIVFIGSREFIRRRFFQLFYMSHVFGVLLFLCVSAAHQYGIIVFLSPAALFYFCDKVIRAVRTHFEPATAVQVDAKPGGITRVAFTKGGPATRPYPGQFVFVSVNNGTIWSRAVNFFNWHPYTISEVLSNHPIHSDSPSKGIVPSSSALVKNVQEVESQDLEKANNAHLEEKVDHGPLRASLYIKDIGRMTRRLHSRAMEDTQRLNVNVDGPYGSSTSALELNEVVVFFEAGIGITPSLTMFRDLAEQCIRTPLLVQTATIHFIWATPSIETAMVFIPHLLHTVKLASTAIHPPRIGFEIYVTKTDIPNGYEAPLPYCSVLPGRPVLTDIVARIDHYHKNENVAAHVCGPSEFMREVNNAGNHRGWKIRQETFEF